MAVWWYGLSWDALPWTNKSSRTSNFPRLSQPGRALAAFHGFVNALEKELDDEVKVAMDLNAAEASLDQLAIGQKGSS